MPWNYRTLIKRSGGQSEGPFLHLIHEDVEASLCGIPSASLTGGGMFDEQVCPHCIERLPNHAVPASAGRAQQS